MGTDLASPTSLGFGSISATVLFSAATTDTVTSPPESIGTVDVTVTTSGGTSTTSAADQYSYGNGQTDRLSATTTAKRLGSATGTVVIKDGTKVTWTIQLVHDTGSCRLPASQLAVGSHSLVADYDGKVPYLPSVGFGKLTVVLMPLVPGDLRL